MTTLRRCAPALAGHKAVVSALSHVAGTPKFGRVSLAGGALAIALAVIARYAASIYVADDWFVTEFIERHGLWRPGDGKLELKATGILTLTELNAITWCYAAAVVASLVAILSSLAAELRGEESLLHSAGHVLGGMGLIAVEWTWGLPALIVSVVAIMLLRHARKEP